MDETHPQQATASAGTVAIVHFFSEKTDGVSLQMEENDRVLASKGWKVIVCSADATGENSFPLPELDYSTPQVQIFKNSDQADLQHEDTIVADFEKMVQVLKDRLGDLIRQHQPRALHVRNMLSLPIHPAATVAMAECIAEHPGVMFLAQHHDFSFEDDFVPGDRKKAYTIPYPRIQRRVDAALLYRAPNVFHAVINTLMQKRLLKEFDLHADVIPDSFNFATQPAEIPDLREKLGIRPNDLVIGAMARIIPRKAMEVAVQFIAALQARKEQFLGEGRGISGRTITADSRFLLLLPQAAGLDEPDNATYFKKLSAYALSLGVELLYIGNRVVADNIYNGETDYFPFYSLYDAVDILQFPSYQEGFGNQFLESVALGKGLVNCHIYPVMESDILPRITLEGIISLGDNSDYKLDEQGLVHLRDDVLQAAADKEVYFLLHPEEELSLASRTRQRLKEAFDAEVVGDYLAQLLSQTF